MSSCRAWRACRCRPAATAAPPVDSQMDLNFGLGWEGMHHDFSDGPQLDLFDGFFFGGQQGGAMAA